MKDNTAVLHHYKNCMFQGFIHDHKKQGEAIVVFDQGSVLIGAFQNDQLSGDCLITLDRECYFIGSFKRGMLDGSFVIRSPQYCIYSRISLNKIQGQILFIDKIRSKASLWSIEDQYAYCSLEVYFQQHFNQLKVLQEISPYTDTQPTIFQFFFKNFSQRFKVSTHHNTKQNIKVSLQGKSLLRKLIIEFESDKLISYGVHQSQGILGLGYIFDTVNSIEIEGEMEKGKLHGEGVKKDLINGKITFGTFSRGDIRTIELLTDSNQQSKDALNKLKKKCHCHSLEFKNDYINQRPIYLLKNLLEKMLKNEENYRKMKNNNEIRDNQSELTKSHFQQSNQGQNDQDQLYSSIRQYNRVSKALKGKKSY